MEEAPPRITPASLADPSTLVLLLEWRAVALVKNFALMLQRKPTATGADGTNLQDVEDATAYQRVSRAITEAFVAGQVEEMLEELNVRGKKEEKLGQREVVIVKKLYTLVS